jgi:asparagine synthase (glutamine-hydrolysing)
MCGIIGTWHSKQSPPMNALKAGLNALKHRGPNDQGLEVVETANGVVALGHTRLSILDLSAAGHQPMRTADGRYSIVFNGEIYNYRELREALSKQGQIFHSDSDTEVLLACWAQQGAACLSQLRGMFAFVVFDQVTQTLTCVRDAFGIKPFFYHQENEAFSFASEIPALRCLLDSPSEINLQRAYDYLIFGSYDNNEDSFFSGIKHLPAGHYLTISLRKNTHATIQRWWWPDITENKNLSFSQAAEQLRDMFLNNVRLHLRSDVPLGAALSGGLDSSAVVCAIRYLEPEMPIHTFSYVARGSSVDEESWVDLINEQVKAIPHKVVVSPEELANDLDDMLKTQGEPFGSTSIYAQYRVFRLARDNGITVTLDGQGADELLAGYHGYPGAHMLSLLDKGDIKGLLTFLHHWSQWPGRSLPRGVMILLRELIPLQWQRLPRKWIGQDTLPHWIDPYKLHERGISTFQNTVSLDNVPERHLMALLRQTLSGGDLSNLLRHGDRNSMRWSIESRVPFLTTDMAEFLLSLPEHYLISPKGETKHVFRAAMRGIVPDTVLDRRDKIGFATPEQAWLKILSKQMADWTEGADKIPFLKKDAVRHEINSVVEGKTRFSFRAWRLLNLCRWAELNLN